MLNIKIGEEVTVIGRDYSWIKGTVTQIQGNYFKVDNMPKYTYKADGEIKEGWYSNHDIVGSLAKSFFGCP